jgi:hypothetical protein
MSKPLRCATCGDMVGVNNGFGHRTWKAPCPGKGKHPKPIREEKPKFFGLYHYIFLHYPGNASNSRWNEFRHESKFLLAIAKLLAGDMYVKNSTREDWSFGRL